MGENEGYDEETTLLLTTTETHIKGFNSNAKYVLRVITKRRNRLRFEKKRMIKDLEKSCCLKSLKET